MEVVFAPIGYKAIVKSIELNNKSICKASSGDKIGFNITGINRYILKRGYVCGDSQNDPPREVESFLAHVFIVNHPG
jgi:elongation factor 1-alpha